MSAGEVIGDPQGTRPYRIDVLSRTKLWFSLSGLVLLVGLTSMAFSLATFGTPLRLGLDFSGGTLLDLRFQEPVTSLEIREVLNTQNLGSSVIQLDQENGQNVLLRMPPLQETERLAVEDALREQVGDYERALVETVGPTVGRQILRSGILSVLISFGLIVVYLGLRFQFDYAVFAIVALLHDVALTIGVFALLGLTVGIEVDSLFVVALLTIIGFSVNDTVVIFDRIRENRRLISRKVTFDHVVNLSLNQTFARSLNTTLTTMLPLVAIAIFGGVTLRSFAVALLVGFALGVYSSIFLAGPLLVWWRGRQFSDQLALESGELDTEAEESEEEAAPDPTRGVV
ncbi:MAG: protein translocase subunit SecF [Cyanophyceae cyanobacterium]